MAADPILKRTLEDFLKSEKRRGVLKPRVQGQDNANKLRDCLDEIGLPYKEVVNPDLLGTEFEVDVSDPQVEFE